jgi:cell division protein FtsB
MAAATPSRRRPSAVGAAAPGLAAPTRGAPRRRPSRRPRPAARPAGAGRVRWDRVGRVALLCLLVVVLMLYVAPLRNWLSQSQLAEAERQEMRTLERERARLSRRARALERPEVIELEARRLGMVRRGERPYVIEERPPSRR